MVKVNPTFAVALVGVVYFTLWICSAQGKTLVKPPRPFPPKSPGPATKFLVNGLNSTLSVPACTTEYSTVASNITTRSGMIDQTYRWKNFYVHAGPEYAKWEHDVINNAMWNLWQELPCVNFGIYPPESKPSGDYVKIVKGTSNGCNSYVGRQGGSQVMNLQSPDCVQLGVVMHEMIHALGFRHEQSRPDRDDYVTVNWDNIDPQYKHAFDKDMRTTTFDLEYDYNSIMHYNDQDFSKNGLPTMTAKAKNGQKMGSLWYLRDSDKKKLKAMYKC